MVWVGRALKTSHFHAPVLPISSYYHATAAPKGRLVLGHLRCDSGFQSNTRSALKAASSHELHTAPTLCLDRAIEKGVPGLQFLSQQEDAFPKHKEGQKKESCMSLPKANLIPDH